RLRLRRVAERAAQLTPTVRSQLPPAHRRELMACESAVVKRDPGGATRLDDVLDAYEKAVDVAHGFAAQWRAQRARIRRSPGRWIVATLACAAALSVSGLFAHAVERARLQQALSDLGGSCAKMDSC